MDGLVSNEANVFLQDRQGFLWVGTFNGLSRFDGAAFRNFLHDPADSTSLGHNTVNGLYQDRHGAIWVGTNGGLDRFDPETETFAHFRHDPEDPTSLGGDVVRTVAESADGAIWVGTSGGGLNRLDPATGTFRRIPSGAPEASPRWDGIHALLPNDDGTLWVGGGDGLALFDPATDTFSPVRLGAGGAASAPLMRIACLLRDQTGAIWAGTVLYGAYRYDPAAQTVTHYPYDPTVAGTLGDPWVLSMIEDHAGTVWLGTNGGGLHRYDPAADAFVRFTYDSSDPQSLRDDDVLALLEDRDGVLWVGTYAGLARRYPLSTVVARARARPGDGGLRSNTVTSFAEEADGTLWVGTDGGGLQRRDPGGTGGLQHVPHEPDRPHQRAATDILSLALDDVGALWVGAIGGLYRRDPGTGGFARVVPTSVAQLIGPVLYDMHAAGGHVFGAASSSGVLEVETASGRIRPALPTPPATVMSVLRDRSGGVWAGTYTAGLWHLAESPDGERALVRSSDEASAEEVRTFYQDRHGAIWVGTADGLDRFTIAGPDTTVTRFHRADGLPNTYIWGIQDDALGRLWVSTSAGLSMRDPRTGSFVSYGAQDGIETGGPLYRSPHTGVFYVGGDMGFAAFNPADLMPEPPLPAPVLTGLEVRGERVRVGAAGSPLARAPSMTDAVRLRYDDRVVRIAFAALDYRAPGTHRYAVRLDGFDDAWRDIGGQREATFTGLSPGRYTFRVRAAGRNGVWGNETALAVTVAPPWWRSWWAYALYALAFGALTAVVVRDRQRRTQLRHRLEIEHLETEALRDLDRAKSQFFANVSHEFRTPLTLTLGPLDDVLAGEYGPVPDEAAEPIGLARRSAGRVLALINQILDVSKLEAGHTPLRARALDLGAFVEAQVEAFVPLATHRQIAVEVTAPDALEVWADPGHFGTILTNLLSNAFKFTPAGGTVSVEIAADERARVVVRDTGPGIAPADLPHVFDRFYQAVGVAGRPLGSGIGLALAHDLAELHGGTLTVESTLGNGSAFVLTVPLGTGHLAPEQIDDQPWHRAVPAPVLDAFATADPPPSEPDGDDVTTVLVVDDEPDIRAFVRRHLEGAGYRVVEAADGEEALERVRHRLPDLVVSDVMMPRLDGLGLCRALRSDPETDFLPVLLLTAKAAPEDRLGGPAELCDDYLTKPFDVRELVARVDTLIAIRRRLRERFAGRKDTETSGDGATAAPAIWSADDAFEARVRSVIDARLGDDAFSVAALAEAVGLSRSHLLRRTTALMGATPSDLIRTARLNQAARLLATQAGTVSEVAYGVGFKSVAHFSNAFLAHTGTRPSAYAEAAE